MQNDLVSRRFSPENAVNGRDGAEKTFFASAEMIPRHPAPTTGFKEMKHTQF